MQIGVPAETRPGETRVAATPETVKKLAAGGRHTILVQSGAGVAASVPDKEFEAAGAKIVPGPQDFSLADIVLKVRGPQDSEVGLFKRGATPGENSMTRNTVPPGSVVPTFLVDASESPELSAGIVSVVHTTQAEAPGRFDTMFFETSSMFTTARPLPSCPVTTRRTLMVMTPPRWVEPIIRGRVSSGFVSAAREKNP